MVILLDIETGIDEIMIGMGFNSFIGGSGVKNYTKVLDNGNSLTIGKDNDEYVAVIIPESGIGKEGFLKKILACSFSDIDDVVEHCMDINRYKKAYE